MNYLKTIIFLLLLQLLSCGILSQKKSEKEDWIKLFNGKDLKDWTIKISGHQINDNYKNTYKVEDGLLRIVYDEYQNFDDKYGHMYYKTPFSHYKLRFTYRFVGNQTPGGAVWNVRNSGIMFHSQSAQDQTLKQEFPASLEIQLLGGLGKGPRSTANLCTPGTIVEMEGKINPEHCINSTSETYEGDQWVTVEALVLGDSLINHLVAGKVVLSYNRPRRGEDKAGKDPIIKDGYIAVQAESHPIDFKSIELLNLVGCMNIKCSNYKSYYVKQGDCTCR